MYVVLLIALVLNCFCNSVAQKSLDNIGVVTLDSFTYPVLVNEHSPHSTFVFCMNKKDIGEYGTDSLREQYVEMALSFMKLLDDADVHKLLFSQIIVNGASNARLGASFGLVPTSNGPVFGFIKAGTEDIIPYEGSFNRYSLVAFLNLHADIKIFVPGTSPEFAPLVAEFIKTSMDHPSVAVEVEITDDESETPVKPEYVVSEKLSAVFNKAQALLDSFEAESDSAAIGDHYLKVSCRYM